MAVSRTAAVVAALFLSACATTGADNPMVGPEWVLRDISGARPLHGTRLTLSLSPDGQVSGSGGCNRFVGRWSQQRGRLTLSGLGASAMACEETVMAQEAAYLEALQGTSRPEVSPDRLILHTADGRAFTFAPAG